MLLAGLFGFVLFSAYLTDLHCFHFRFLYRTPCPSKVGDGLFKLEATPCIRTRLSTSHGLILLSVPW